MFVWSMVLWRNVLVTPQKRIPYILLYYYYYYYYYYLLTYCNWFLTRWL
jgi:hypothetical protein